MAVVVNGTRTDASAPLLFSDIFNLLSFVSEKNQIMTKRGLPKVDE